MAKLVVLNIVSGDFENGFPLFLEIATEGEYRFAEAESKLPSYPDLLNYYKNWQTPYSSLVSSLRSSRASVTATNTSISEIKAASKNLKSSLNKWLDSPEMHSISKTLSRNLKDESEEIRFVIKTQIPELQRLPWHLWDDFFQHYRRAEVALSLGVKRRRQKVDCRRKTRVLAVFGKREVFGNTTIINTEKDWELLQQHLSDTELIRLVEPQLEDLYEALDNQSPDLFFFAGHSSSEENGAKGLIDLNQDETIEIDDLKPALRKATERGLQLAIFNSCDGLGIARELADLHIPQIIVMREPVPDLVAQKFLRRFLEAFTGERSVCLAVRRAREKIHSLEPKYPGATWLPIVFQNPAELPLTGKEFRRIATGIESQLANPKSEELETENKSQILWLPTTVNPSESEQKQSPPDVSQLSQTVQQPPTEQESSITCSKGHENPATNCFCIHCGERLKVSETGSNNSSPSSGQSSTTGVGNSSPLSQLPSPTGTGNQGKIAPKAVFGALGTILGGRYKLCKELGEGGFGETYLAEDIDRFNVICVVKKIRFLYSDPSVLQKVKELFYREAAVLYRLGTHNQIPALFAYFEQNGEFYIVQEFIDGQDLSRELIPGKQMPESYVILLLQDVLEILEFVHSHGVIHRDIKPGNLIRRKQDGKLVLIDFGAVKKITNPTFSSQGMTNTSVIIGTPGYMPPEQMRGKPQFSSDIFALGITAIQALTGILANQLPVDSQTGEINWRDQVNNVSPQLAIILDKMLRYDFRERYQSATEVLQDLSRSKNSVVCNQKISSGMPAKVRYSRRIWSSKISWIAASVVLLLIVFLALLKFSPKAPIPEQPSPTPRLEKDQNSPNSQPTN